MRDQSGSVISSSTDTPKHAQIALRFDPTNTDLTLIHLAVRKAQRLPTIRVTWRLSVRSGQCEGDVDWLQFSGSRSAV